MSDAQLMKELKELVKHLAAVKEQLIRHRQLGVGGAERINITGPQAERIQCAGPNLPRVKSVELVSALGAEPIR
jgi:hypothetical protein